MKEIIPGIYLFKIPLPDTLRMGYVNTYLVRGEPGHLLIDSGWDTEEAYRALTEQLAEIGADITQISRIAITHLHADHYGMAGRVKKMSGATLYLHHLDSAQLKLRYIDMEPLLEQTIEWLRRNGVPEDIAPALQQASVEMAQRHVIPTMPDVELQGGETLSTGLFNLKVIWAPGHSQGQVCFYEPEKKLLFSGDHVLPNITPHISLHPQSSPNPMGDFIQSLKQMAEIDARQVLPAHEEPFTNLKKRIEEVIEHHRERNRQIIEQLEDGPRTAFGIATGMPWRTDTGGVSFDRLDPVDKRLAVLETLAHLEALRVDGRVTRALRNGTDYFQKA